MLFLFSFGCRDAGKKTEVQSENDIDAARNFIRAALDGDYEKGKKMMVGDSTNFQYFEEFEKLHTKMDAAEKKKYQGSSINVHAVTPVNDSVTLIIYSNSYKNDHDTLKLVKTHGQWLVDLKYLFNHDMDTLPNHSNKTDSLK